MASDGSNTIADNKPNGRWLAFWLVLGSFVVGSIGCGISRYYHNDPNLLTPAFVGLVFGQASLVGLWGGLGNRNWLVRLVAVLVGLIYLSGVLCVGCDRFEGHTVLMVMFVGLSVAGLLMISRCFGLRIHATGIDAADKPAQFSILQLILLTVVVACVATIAKWLTPHVVIDYPVVLLLFLIPFVILGLVSAWAILGTKYSRLGTIAAMLLSPLLGLGSKMVIEMSFDTGNTPTGYWITVTGTATLFLIVSLHAIRRFGFRIRRQRKTKPAFVGGELHEDDECGTLES